MPGASKQRSDAPVLSRLALNRALLARQGLLRRGRRPAIEVVDHLVGMQAQVPRDPYTALWSRIEGFDPAELEQLLLDRKVARSTLLRGTIHLATAEDCLAVRAAMQPTLARLQKHTFGRTLAGADLAALAQRGRTLLAKQPMTFARLRGELGDPWPEYDQTAVAYSISALVPLVQVPPRGLWTRSSAPTWQTTEAYLGRKLPKRASLDDLVRRYLAAFGPASPNDAQTWSSMTGLREVFERLRPELVTFQDEHGVELFDLPEAPRPPEDTPAPVRFLPQYDNVLLSHADRSRIAPREIPPLGTRDNEWLSWILVDGFMAAIWRLQRDGRTSATLRITPFRKWPQRTQRSVAAEANRFVEFIAHDARAREVVFDPPAG